MDVVGGRYRLVELIGTGGMGRVWRAVDELLQREVAVKEVTGGAAMLREARAAARLGHPGVVKVYDVFESWIVMEYVDGVSLQRALPLPVDEVCRIGLSVVAALRVAHDAGVLHRDVKPDNVLLARDGRVVLGDFGLASIRCEDGPDPRLGSPNYVAPERLSGDDSGVPADLWSLGATLYAAVEGRAPFARDDTEASLWAVVSAPPDPPVAAGALAPLLLDLLSKEPSRRPSAGEVEHRLTRVLAARPARGRAQVPPVPPVPPVPGRWRRPLPMAVVTVMLVLVTAGVAATSAHFRLDPSSSSPTLAAGASPSPTAAAAASPSRAPEMRPMAFGLCGADPQPVTPATATVPADLPSDWTWVREPAGFALALPDGWRRVVDGANVCYTSPDGRQAFTVGVVAVVAGRPLEYWQNREKAAALPGYRRISMGVLLLRRGGADWEYTYRPDSGTVRHERRVLLAVSGDRSYLLRFTTADRDWAASTALQRRLVDLFASAA
ncbi:serine/threonine-protein kinase [Actinoplanes sp. NPDC023714]|uniref:serine/threonine-protein kinase n=1 Tax=Actinoplanes sp. NPDC023714 TaxID=3154322 RepID=UPI0033D5D1D1